VRTFAILAVLAAAIAYVAIRHLPEEASAHPARPVPAQASRDGFVRGIAFEGEMLPVAALRAQLSVRPGDALDREALFRDRAALETYLASSGYLAAKVEPAQVHVEVGGAVYVTFAIAQGPRFHVRSVTVTGAAVKDAGVVTLGPGEIVSADRIARARDALVQRLAARGKRIAEVVANVALDHDAAVADIELVAR
jgi:outer membrane protein assembly factor BamA